jgi:hypothetical protein
VLAGRRVALVDDAIASGGSIVASIRLLRAAGTRHRERQAGVRVSVVADPVGPFEGMSGPVSLMIRICGRRRCSTRSSRSGAVVSDVRASGPCAGLRPHSGVGRGAGLVTVFRRFAIKASARWSDW